MRRFLIILMALILTGCANQFTKFYRDNTAAATPEQIKVLMPWSGKTVIYSSNNMRRDADSLVRKDYVPIGESAFHGSARTTHEMLVSQAETVGADIVLYYSEYLGSEQAVVPYTQYNPGQISTTHTTGTMNANSYGSGGYAYGTGTYSGTSTTTSPGTYSTSMMPITRQNYSHDAIFWRKRKPGIMGVNTINLPDDIRKTLQRNTGVVVKAVHDDSPAFRANILAEDVITSIDGVPIDSQKEMNDKIIQFANKKCDVAILRDGKPMTISVQMNPRAQ